MVASTASAVPRLLLLSALLFLAALNSTTAEAEGATTELLEFKSALEDVDDCLTT